MGRFITGVLIILTVLCVNGLVSFISTSVAGSVGNIPGCSETDNETTCNDVGRPSFVASLADTTFTGIAGAPDVFNFFWVLIGSILLSTGVILIILAFVPLTAE